MAKIKLYEGKNIFKKQGARYSAEDIANWFLSYNNYIMGVEDAEYISNLKLQKLLYYAQGIYLALEDRPLFKERLVAWQHGPVVEKIYQKYKNYESRGIDNNESFNVEKIDKDTRDILVQVYNIFGQYSAWKLRNMTHEEEPWITTNRNDYISNEKIKEYFIENYIE